MYDIYYSESYINVFHHFRRTDFKWRSDLRLECLFAWCDRLISLDIAM